MAEMITQAYEPCSLAEALEIRSSQPVIPFAGGTDLMVRRRSWAGTLPKFEAPVLFLGRIPELRTIGLRDDVLAIGATATLSSILEHREVPEILKRAVAEMASPAIRNMGTLGGNLCNASPAADTLPPIYALGASVVLRNVSGERRITIADFINGPGQTVLKADELLVAVEIPLDNYNMVYYKKIGTRKADALSKVSFAGLARIKGGIITDVRLAIGAVAPQVVRCRDAENLCQGKRINELPNLIHEMKEIYARPIRPIDDQRSNAVYRKMVSLRLIEYFLSTIKEN